MLRHIVLIRFTPEATPAQTQAWAEAVRAMCEGAAEVRSYSVGFNVGQGPNHHDAAAVMDFDDLAAFRAYVASPAHADYVEAHAKPIVASLAAIQHELGWLSESLPYRSSGSP